MEKNESILTLFKKQLIGQTLPAANKYVKKYDYSLRVIGDDVSGHYIITEDLQYNRINVIINNLSDAIITSVTSIY